MSTANNWALVKERDRNMLWLRRIRSDWKHFRILFEILLYDLTIRVSGGICQVGYTLRTDDFNTLIKGVCRIDKLTNVSPLSMKL